MEINYKETTAFSNHPKYGDINIHSFDLEETNHLVLYYCNHFIKINPDNPHVSALFAAKNNNEDIDLIFVSACSFFFDNPSLLYPGYATPSGGEIIENSPLVSFYLTFPQKFGIPSIDHDALLFIAITGKELEILSDRGPDSLDSYFIENNIDIFDIYRKN